MCYRSCCCANQRAIFIAAGLDHLLLYPQLLLKLWRNLDEVEQVEAYWCACPIRMVINKDIVVVMFRCSKQCIGMQNAVRMEVALANHSTGAG